MSTYEVALLLHIAGAVAYFSGIAVAGFAFLAARRRPRPGEVAAVLSLARSGVLLAAAGSVLLLAFGFWLVDLAGHSFGDAWLAAALALFVAAAVLGGAAGQAPKRARRLAERLAAEGDRPDPELGRLLGHRPSLVLNAVATLAALAVLVLMIWRPGA